MQRYFIDVAATLSQHCVLSGNTDDIIYWPTNCNVQYVAPGTQNFLTSVNFIVLIQTLVSSFQNIFNGRLSLTQGCLYEPR